jgi:hypothetical protein
MAEMLLSFQYASYYSPAVRLSSTGNNQMELSASMGFLREFHIQRCTISKISFPASHSINTILQQHASIISFAATSAILS